MMKQKRTSSNDPKRPPVSGYQPSKDSGFCIRALHHERDTPPLLSTTLPFHKVDNYWAGGIKSCIKRALPLFYTDNFLFLSRRLSFSIKKTSLFLWESTSFFCKDNVRIQMTGRLCLFWNIAGHLRFKHYYSFLSRIPITGHSWSISGNRWSITNQQS